MSRLPDWEQRLSVVIAEHRFTPHAWGSHDCLLFTAKVVRALTGKDLARGHRGKYKSQASAYRYLKKLGHKSVEAFLDSKFEQKPAGFAQRGDIVMAADGIPAICLGAFAVSVGQEDNAEGLVGVPRSAWVKAWAV